MISQTIQSSKGLVGLDYPAGYIEPKNLQRQCELLVRYFPELSPRLSYSQVDMALPEHIEGWFAIPRWQAIASSYANAIELLFDRFRSKILWGLFSNLGRRISGDLCPTEMAIRMFSIVENAQPESQILVIPAQFGGRRRGISAQSFIASGRPYEFGLGVFAVGCMILTHPERITGEDVLGMLCVGDVFKNTRDPLSGLLSGGFQSTNNTLRFRSVNNYESLAYAPVTAYALA